jgi:hypothetical protein
VLNPIWDGFSEPASPVIKAIGIHRLSEKSHGNGGGMALADIVSTKFYEALDLPLTWKHMISCNWTVGGKVPVCAGNDAEVFPLNSTQLHPPTQPHTHTPSPSPLHHTTTPTHHRCFLRVHALQVSATSARCARVEW